MKLFLDIKDNKVLTFLLPLLERLGIAVSYSEQEAEAPISKVDTQKPNKHKWVGSLSKSTAQSMLSAINRDEWERNI